MEDVNRIWLLLGKRLSSSITPAESKELSYLLSRDPELWYACELLEAVIGMDDVPETFINEIKSLLDQQAAPEKLNELLAGQLDREVQPVAEERSVSSGKFVRRTAIAAFILLLACAGWFFMKARQSHTAVVYAMNEIVAPKGSKTQITLADGTSIWLNAGSRLLYPKSFSLENRQVFLTGEAYFKVVHNERYAFVVHTAEADIVDLGTTFNVKAYAGNPTTETTLIEGAVEVILKKDRGKKILMQPKEKLIVHHLSKKAKHGRDEQNEQIFEVSKIVPFAKTNDIVETAWVENKLIFRNQKFEELAKDMERRYNVRIVVTDERVNNYYLTGIFKNENIVEALKLLQVIAPFKFEINNEQIIISR
jgi:ferric-dicitrate binding protein FerR (iron transport regulator)